MSCDNLGISHNRALLKDLFENISQNHDAFMCRSSHFSRAGTSTQKPAEDEEGRQLSAKLHSLFGFPNSKGFPQSKAGGKNVLFTQPYARSRVYDLRNYTDKNKWGPFRKDGSMRVDWEMIESIMIVLGYNSFFSLQTLSNRLQLPWLDSLEGIIPDMGIDQSNYIALLQEPELPLDMKDPYRVQGIWSRVWHLQTDSIDNLLITFRLFASWITLIYTTTTSKRMREEFLLINQEHHFT